VIEGTEGEWKWVTGPEAGTTFWNGNASGSAAINPNTGLPYYSNWNIPNPAEPNHCCDDAGNEDYAHITDNTIGIPGSWNDLTNTGAPNGPYQPKGYIVEYGGTPGDPVLNISTSTSIFIPQITNFDPVKRNCTGGTMTFTATASEGEIYWYDAPTGGNLIEIGDTFTTPSLTSSKKYYVSASPEGCATTQRIAVDAIIDTTPVVIATQFDINRCDEDRDGFLNFDLQVDQTPIILAGLDPILNPVLTDFEVLYFDDRDEAEANNTLAVIDNPYKVDTSPIPTTISARIHNKNNNGCYTIVNFDLKVTDTPILTQPLDYRLCDDTASAGGDTDGVSSFLLNTIDDEILTNVTNPGEYTISYHTDILDAQTSSTTNAIDKDADYQITTSQTVYVRIENNNDPTLCYTVSDDSPSSTFKSFKLIVDPLPVVNTGVEIDYCIVTGDPNPTVDLTQAEASISSTTNASFEYFRDLAGTDLILDPVSYPPVGNVLQSVYVKVISDQGCARDLVELVLNIGETPNNSFDDLVAIECDDFLDPDGNDTPAMNDDTDNITNFSLDLTAILTAINPPINTEVFFYESTSDRNSNSNNIPDLTNYRNNPTNIDISIVPDGIKFPIYYKILSTINNDCEGIGQFYLQINQVPLNSSNTLPPIVECDNAIWDGDFTNGSNDRIDLTQIIGTSAGQIFEGTGQDVAEFDFSFFTSEAGAFSGDITSTDYINTPNQFTNSVPTGFVIGDVVTQTIYVRIKNKDTQCINPHTSFDVIINPAPITTTPILPVEVCDIGAQDGDTGNGYAQNIDISGTDFYVLDGRPAADFTITYHKNLIDLADLTSDGVDKTDYDSDPTRVTIDPVTKISEEELYIRIINISSPSRCVFDQSTVTIIVYPEPTTEIIPNQLYCDDDSDGEDTNGIVQNINLDGLIPDILGPLQPIGDFSVTFHADPLDLPDGANALTTPHENISSPNQQRIYVRVENIDTGCVNDDLFFDVIVNPLPKFKVTSPQIVCLSGPPLTLFIENPDAVYDYVWTAPNGDEFPGVEEITIESGGLYTVTATTTNGTDCSRTREIQVNESIIATITDADVTIVDDSDNNSITIDPTNLGIGDYQYALINENGVQTAFQDIPVFESLSGGFYTIVVQDKNGCRPDANLIVSVIEYPKFFTPNNDGINDTWAIKGANSTFYPSAQINIFNRFGKIVAQIDVDNPGWDGTYGGKRLPSDDYWFSIMMVDRNGNARERKGNFSLLRR
jgi:gliding motility-associated-like protein